MPDSAHPRVVTNRTRPDLPKRAVITAGMPYGNKGLHFGHVGGVFVQADTFARFLRDRIGHDRVIFVSGTDCYGSPIVEAYRSAKDSGDFDGSLEDFVRSNHDVQRHTLKAYHIDLNLFAASSIGRYKEIHQELGALLLRTLYSHGHVEKRSTAQFYDSHRNTFLNGRQVQGRCPVVGCRSEKAYADECALGHQYEPEDLIDPKSTLSGRRPEMRDSTNWYLKLPEFRDMLRPLVEGFEGSTGWRAFVIRSMLEYFEPPVVHVTLKQIAALDEVAGLLPSHSRREGRAKSVQLVFDGLEDMAKAVDVLRAHSIRYRTGKTIVPFRLTGNLEWGLPVPELEGLSGLTFWVWPESLWAPMSFTAAYLEGKGGHTDDWRQWWCSKEAEIYQFIGEDNVFFYSLPQMAMFLGMQGRQPLGDPPEGAIHLPTLIANRHLLFLDKKASSSGTVRPPMAADLLNFYTPDQLRIHFLSLALGARSVSFRPKPLNPKASEKEADPVLKDGNLLSNSFNRAIRSCFYTAQKYFDGKVPVGEISREVLENSENTILDYEAFMLGQEFHQAIATVGRYIREINQSWSRTKPYSEACDPVVRRNALIDAFHKVRVATSLLHPVAPEGTEKVREYLRVDEEFWSWERIFEPIYGFMDHAEQHVLKFLEPRVDFFRKHPSQIND